MGRGGKTTSKMLGKRDDKIYKAAEFLFEHEEAREAWLKLQTNRGGMVEAAKLLGLEKQFDQYKSAFMAFHRAGKNSEAAKLLTMTVLHFCDLLEERFGKKPA